MSGHDKMNKTLHALSIQHDDDDIRLDNTSIGTIIEFDKPQTGLVFFLGIQWIIRQQFWIKLEKDESSHRKWMIDRKIDRIPTTLVYIFWFSGCIIINSSSWDKRKWRHSLAWFKFFLVVLSCMMVIYKTNDIVLHLWLMFQHYGQIEPEWWVIIYQIATMIHRIDC